MTEPFVVKSDSNMEDVADGMEEHIAGVVAGVGH